jgi:RNA polymerase sigma-70 factor (ECF subfamily)
MGGHGLTEEAAPEERFRSVFFGHYHAVRRSVTRLSDASDIDDVVAETFLVAWRRIDELPAEPRVWLLAVARKTAANRHRSARRRAALTQRIGRERSLPALQQPTDSEASPVLVAFATLGRGDQDLLALICWDGLSTREAATVIGCSHGALRVRLHRARRRLEALLGTQHQLAVPTPPALPTPSKCTGELT